MTTPVLIAFLGALLSALAAIWSSVNQADESEQNSKLSKQLAAKSDEIAKKSDQYADRIDDYAKMQAESDSEIKTLQGRLIDKAEIQNQKTEQIARLNAELAQSQKEIARLSIETTNNVTGGDSYCMVRIWPESSNKAQVTLTHEGVYPLSEVKISIQRVSEIDEYDEKFAGKIGWEEFWKGRSAITTFFEMRSIPPDTGLPSKLAHQLGYVPFIPGKNETYQIEFIAKNGIWTENYSFKYNDAGKLTTSYKVGRPPIKGIENHYIVLQESPPVSEKK